MTYEIFRRRAEMKKKLAMLLALCTLMMTGVIVTGCSQSSEPQKAAAPAPAPAKEEAKQEAAPAASAEAEEEDEDKFGC